MSAARNPDVADAPAAGKTSVTTDAAPEGISYQVPFERHRDILLAESLMHFCQDHTDLCAEVADLSRKAWLRRIGEAS